MRYTILLCGVLAVLAACSPTVTNFEECVAAGNPVMESYPRQCVADGQTFVEEVPDEPDTPDGTPDGMEGTGFAGFTACEDPRPEACTLEYRPVCGVTDSEAITFGNDCTACQNASVQGYYEGACEDQTFVVCQPTQTGFDAEEFARDNNGICVDACPDNMDPFTTQIGVQMCITHYGVEEISEWPVCEASSETCDCVRTYETTTGEQIADAEYRCVPDLYAQRLLFRGGQDRLDESGQQSVLIA